MGVAESFDEGITWKRFGDAPIMPLGQSGSWDTEAACVPMVIRVNGLWRMWYTASSNRKENIGIAHATSKDGLQWEKVTDLTTDGTSETTLRFAGNDEMIAMVRCESGNRHGQIGVSKPPYKGWVWHDMGERLGGPNFIILPDQTMVAGSRQSKEKATTVLARSARDKYEPVLPLPVGVDTSYPGRVWHEDQLWVIYIWTRVGKRRATLVRCVWE